MNSDGLETIGIIWNLTFSAAVLTMSADFQVGAGASSEVGDLPKGAIPFTVSGDLTAGGVMVMSEALVTALGRKRADVFAEVGTALGDVLGRSLALAEAADGPTPQGPFVQTGLRLTRGKESHDVDVLLSEGAAETLIGAFGDSVWSGQPDVGDDEEALPPEDDDAVHPVIWPPFGGGSTGGPAPGLELFYDVPLTLTAELGRVERRVEEVMALGPGSIVELERMVGEPVEIWANGQWIARGEVVVVEENFGVRITEIGTTQDRVAKLRLREGS